MKNTALILTTALAPIIWGSSYLVTTEYLPQGYPLTLAMLRALPVGLLLLVFCKQLPPMHLVAKLFLLGALNFSIFWWLLFVSAYRLPGGVAATIGAIQPLLVIFLARGFLNTTLRSNAVLAALLGIFGVALLLLTAQAKLDLTGLIAGIGGAISMAFGTVLSKKWLSAKSVQTATADTASYSPILITAWQLVAGGLLLLPAAMWLEPALPVLSLENYFGFIYLGLIGAGLTYFLWFRGLALLSPTIIAPFGFLSPVSAVLLGWLILDQHLSVLQILGALIVLFSVWLSQQNLKLKNLLSNTFLNKILTQNLESK